MYVRTYIHTQCAQGTCAHAIQIRTRRGDAPINGVMGEGVRARTQVHTHKTHTHTHTKTCSIHGHALWACMLVLAWVGCAHAHIAIYTHMSGFAILVRLSYRQKHVHGQHTIGKCLFIHSARPDTYTQSRRSYTHPVHVYSRAAHTGVRNMRTNIHTHTQSRHTYTPTYNHTTTPQNNAAHGDSDSAHSGFRQTRCRPHHPYHPHPTPPYPTPILISLLL